MKLSSELRDPPATQAQHQIISGTCTGYKKKKEKRVEEEGIGEKGTGGCERKLNAAIGAASAGWRNRG